MLFHDPAMALLVLEYITVVLMGMVFGSFASAVVYRIPNNYPWITGAKSDEHGLRSACPKCKAKLTAADLVPILSWVFLKGKCRHCSAKISAKYPLIELSTLLVCMGVYLVFGITFYSVVLFLLMPFLITLIAIDLEHMVLPNELVLISGFLGGGALIANAMSSQYIDTQGLLQTHLIGMIVFAGFAWALGIVMEKVLEKEALGFGDVKFFAVAGLWLGWEMLGMFCILSGLIGVALALLWRALGRGAVFPFGPALIIALYVILLMQGSHFA